MRTSTTRLAALALAMPLVVASGSLADEPAVTGDLARLQGQWSARLGPKRVPMTVTIKGTAASMTIATADGQEHESKGEIRIDEDARPFKTLDWVKFTKPDGEPAPENLGIYKFEGDSITICNGGPGRDRPSEFRAGVGGPPQLLVLNRKTSKEAATPTGGDLARLQGRWTAKVGPEKQVTLVVTIKDNTATLAFGRPGGQQRESKGEIRIDEDARPFKTLDWVKFTTRGGDTAPDNFAIYKLEGNTLTICTGGGGNERPTEFRAGEDNKPSLIVLKRE